MKTALLTLLLIFFFASCERDFSASPAQSDISFSADTLSFDTIYAGVTTPTAHFTIHNDGNDDVTISSIQLLHGDNSPFAVNIAGQSTSSASNIRIAHGDSVFVFASVRNPQPSNGKALTLLQDHIVAQGGNASWTMTLQAVVLNVSRQSGSIVSDTQWLCDTIPYLVQDTLSITNGARLTIGPNVTVLFQNKATLQVDGSLIVAGVPDNRASFLPMRQDGFYQDIPGQWGGIDILPGATASFSYANVACPTNGISVDSTASLFADGLWLRDVSHAAISSRHANLTLRNALITNSGGASVSLTGGTTELTHVTIANYFSWDARRTEALLVSRADSAMTSLRVFNSIIVGSHNPEVVIDSIAGDVLFSGSLLRAEKKKLESNTKFFQDCLTASDAHFASRDDLNYHLTPSSDAIGLGQPKGASLAPTDFEGFTRFAADSIQAGAFQIIEQQ